MVAGSYYYFIINNSQMARCMKQHIIRIMIDSLLSLTSDRKHLFKYEESVRRSVLKKNIRSSSSVVARLASSRVY